MDPSVEDVRLDSARRFSVLDRVRSLWSVETLGRDFWLFFTAAFFFDLGFGLYFFLFNLFLLSQHFDERAIGIITSALTLGNVIGTLPVSILARRFGLQKLLLFCFIVVPLISICRTFALWMPAQIGLAFLTGVALSSWPVCFAPSIAKVTTEKNRVFAFSISFATGIGTGTIAGLVGGSLPGLLKSNRHALTNADGMRFVLIGASVVAMLGIWPILRLTLGVPDHPERRRMLTFHPYLFRFLPGFALWSIVSGSFIPFAPIFFQKNLGMSLQKVGMIFSASQLAQFCAVLIAPLLYRRVGSVSGIVSVQVAAAASIFALGFCHNTSLAIACYLVFTALQFSTGPGFYGLLMSRVPEADRSSASGAQNVTGALSQTASAALTGTLILHDGYGLIFKSSAVLSLFAAVVVFSCLASDQLVTYPRSVQSRG
ncbi:MAG TPA: MFS transporter [Terracidiphilus sp.]|jgi:MFS family permease